jgi:PST family polysaccharide transporter
LNNKLVSIHQEPVGETSWDSLPAEEASVLGEFFDAYGFVGAYQLISTLYGFLRAKILALWLGPSGVGIFAQADLLMKSTRRFMSLGVSIGLTKQVSEYRGRGEYGRISRLISTVVLIYIVIGFLLSLAAALLSARISQWIFGSEEYGVFIVAIALAAVAMLEYAVLVSLLRGFLRWREITWVTALAYSISLLSTLLLIRFAGLAGAIWSLLISQATQLLVTAYFLRRGIGEEFNLQLPGLHLSWGELGIVSRLIGPLGLIQLVSAISPLWVRGEILRQLGAGANGIYQVVWGISMGYMGFLTNITTSYGMPKVAADLDHPSEITKVQNNSLRINLLLFSPLIVSLFMLREFWIPILYRKDFLAAGDIMIWHFAGDLLRVVRESWNISLLPKERFGYLAAENILLWGGWALLSIPLLPSQGLTAVPLAYLIANAMLLIPNLIYMILRTQFELWPQNSGFLAKIASLLSLGLYLGNITEMGTFRLLALAGVLVGLAVWPPERGEYAKVLKWARGNQIAPGAHPIPLG